MRSSAILIGIFALFLTSCSLEPHIRQSSKDALGKLKGPQTSSIDAELASQAAQAENQGNFRQSVEMYKQLVDKSPDNVQYQLDYATSLRRTGACNASLKVTDAIIAKDAENAGALENKGLCLMSTGEFAEAGTVFGDVMKIDGKRWRTLNAVGILFTMKGKYDDAIAYFQAALNVSTDNPSVLNNAALAYAIDHQFDRAYDAFARARRHVQEGSADMKHLALNLALVYAVNGKLDMAEQTASPYLTKEGLYNNMGFYSYLAKNNDLAKGYLNMALTQSPTYYERAWKNLGALTGDPSVTGGQPLPSAIMPGNLSAPLPATGLTNENAAAPVTQPVGIALEDIPESKAVAKETALKSPEEKDKPEAKPSESVKKTEGKPVKTAKASPKKPEAKPVPMAKESAKDTSDSDSDVPAPVMTKESVENKAEPVLNPDVVLLHKPAPSHNPDWDTDKKADAPAIAAPEAAPAAGGSGGN